MGRINIVISNDIERRLRIKAIERFGGRKGSLSLAIEEAINLWLKTNEENRFSFR